MIPNLSNTVVETYQTGIDEEGNSIVAFTNNQVVLQAVNLTSTGAIRLVSPIFGALGNVLTYQLIVSQSGNAALVWTFNGSSNTGISSTVIQASYQPFNGDWEPVVTLTTPGFNITEFHAAIDELGNVIVAWRAVNSNTRKSVAQASFKAFDNSTWQVPGSPNFPDNNLSSSLFNVTQTPTVGISHGNAAVSWQIFNGLSGDTISTRRNVVVQAAFKPRNKPFQKPINSNLNGDPRFQDSVLSTIGFNVSTIPRVTSGGNTALITWQLSVPSNNPIFPTNVIQAFIHHFDD